ncbi:hypothetical protein DFJ58DRAFT_347283 [Suillus subalutaceus]|uniref:uncharacterized protein n=1 Tax=Suillus subalutaceus TaxID=48586 RepID=UPI001B86B441|nr:uncharacterized protein DFJ58DRAFT_347283 [Suillus subalutaceus]KAG1827847.1 hypothetical protein DFJ58DRAFT_347283 [Suillus subalutaceus]
MHQRKCILVTIILGTSFTSRETWFTSASASKQQPYIDNHKSIGIFTLSVTELMVVPCCRSQCDDRSHTITRKLSFSWPRGFRHRCSCYSVPTDNRAA